MPIFFGKLSENRNLSQNLLLNLFTLSFLAEMKSFTKNNDTLRGKRESLNRFSIKIKKVSDKADLFYELY